LFVKIKFFAVALTVLTASQIPAFAAGNSATAIMRVSVTVTDMCSVAVNPADSVRQNAPVSVACNAGTPYRVSVSKETANRVLPAAAPVMQYSSLPGAVQPANAGAAGTDADAVLVSIIY